MKRFGCALWIFTSAILGCAEPSRMLTPDGGAGSDLGPVPVRDGGVNDTGVAGDSAVVDRPPVRGVRSVVLTGAPADSPMRFGGANDAARAPTWVYPEDETIVPPNLPGFEVHFRPGGNNDLFEVSFAGDVTTINVYTPCARVADGCVLTLDTPTFDMIASAGRAGGRVRMTIRGTTMGAAGPVGTSAVRSLGMTQTDLRGGVYYWASTIEGQVVRYEFGREGARPEVFLQGPNPFACVGCHVLSRDGTRMAATYGMPGFPQTQLIDVATRMQRGPSLGTNFGSFSPDNRRYIASTGSVLSLYNADTAMPMLGLEANTTGSHPDWSPSGDFVVYSRPRQTIALPVGMPGHSGPADLMLLRWMTSTFGAPRTLVESQGENNYYPGFSPDSQWVVFNRSTGGSYLAPDAALWAVRADGTGRPVALARANGQGNRTNSWPKWTPFVERYVGELEEPLLWVTFSSRRNYGLRLQQESMPADSQRSQLWMAAFRPRGAGMDPSSPAFWLPFQNIGVGNHIAQWVETVRRQDCTMDRNCPAGETCQNGRCVGAPP